MTREMGWAFFWVTIGTTNAVYLTMVLWSLPKIAGMAGGLQPFDLRPMGYSPDEGRAFLAAITPEGRSFYADVQHRLDLAFPGLLALTLILSFHRLAGRRLALILSALAAIGAAFDWAENRAVAQLLAAPVLNDADIRMASQLTLAKSAAVTLAVTALTVLLVRAGWQGWRSKSGRAGR